MYRTITVRVEGGAELECWGLPELALHPDDQCIVSRNDILEFGRVVKLGEREGPTPGGRDGLRVLRRATLQDQSRADENNLMKKMAMKTCQAVSQRLGLQLRWVRGHYSFDRSVLMVEFTSEERLDLRELIRQVGEELRTRVELKQLGVRDEAGIIGGMGTCGRMLCCCTWINRFASINVKMAKTQGLSLNPAAIGGCCGRLKCCLSYENECYKELARKIPAKGSRVECPDGRGCVEDRDLLRQRVKVCLDDERMVEYPADEVRELWGGRKPRRRNEDDENSGDERAELEPAGNAGAANLREDNAGRHRGPRKGPGRGNGRRDRNVPEQ
jgi:cell fate regulator YaaT (PSP1 superfamily)